MKNRIYKIKDKILVQGNENELTKDEVLVKEENGSVVLKERVNGEVKSIAGGNENMLFVEITPTLKNVLRSLEISRIKNIFELVMTVKNYFYTPFAIYTGAKFMEFFDSSSTLTKEEIINNLVAIGLNLNQKIAISYPSSESFLITIGEYIQQDIEFYNMLLQNRITEKEYYYFPE